MTLTGRVAAAALAGALAVLAFGSVTALAIVNGILALAVAADLGLAASLAGVRVTRSGATAIHLGEQGTVTIAVANDGRRRLRGAVRDGWRPSAGALPGRAPVDVPAGSRALLTTTLTPVRRGDVAGGPVTVRSLGPLGLAGRQRSVSAPWTVRVLPAFPSRRHLPARLARLAVLDGQRRTILRGQGSEFDSLRSYVLGDDVRSIDWRSSARRADVLVRTWRPERSRRIVLVLDTGRGSAGRVGHITRLDAAMDATLLLAALAVRAGDRVDLIAADRRVRARVVGVGRDTTLASFARDLAPIEPDLTEPDMALLVAATLTAASRRCLVVLFTDLNPAAVEEGLLPHLGLLTTRHQVVLAAVADPAVERLAAGRDDAAAVYHAAAAAAAMARRARTAELLRAHGAQVIDATPAGLAPAVADAYLGLKAAGRL